MLTLAQRKTLNFLEAFIAENDYAPTSAEIALGIGIKSRGVVHRYLKALQNEGVIDLLPGRHRNIVLMQKQTKPDTVEGLPIVGLIMEGHPLQVDSINGMVDIEATMMSDNRFALKVRGSTMIREGIFEGDILICQYADNVRHGQAVVALIDGKHAVLRRVFPHDDGTTSLLGIKAKYQPQRIPSSRVYIQGLYIGLFRLHEDLPSH